MLGSYINDFRLRPNMKTVMLCKICCVVGEIVGARVEIVGDPAEQHVFIYVWCKQPTSSEAKKMSKKIASASLHSRIICVDIC